ncbi:uncharacterized protein LOC143297796 [Babylonia areolata]|uniref:uncharacterized protein LOC143297796 n=1 Tax=Babylonia areolata TaxID=304850 RepID=UPI003FD5B02B
MASVGGGDVAADTQPSKLTCAICLENFRRPKILPCFHTYCQSCLQGVAGSSPSFPCPSCRAIVLLPPGGVGALKTNTYIESDLASTSASPPQRLCDVCTDDREATHSCLQCQQRYCLPCRKNHDSFRSCHGHTLVSLTQEEEEGCGKGIPQSEKQKVEMCPKHPDQRLLLHCNQCETDLCLQCKLTQHEGHPTEDLADTRSKAKDKLKDKLGTLTLDIQETDHLISAFEDRHTKLQQQKQTMEQDFRARADMLHQWVNQSLDEAISSIQSSNEQLAKPWQDQAELLRQKKLALQARQGHILQVLKDGKEADLVAMEAELSSGPMEDVDMNQMKKELTRDIPTFRVGHSTTAVNRQQLRAFVGVLEPLPEAPHAEENVCHSSAQGRASEPVKGPDVSARTHSPPSKGICGNVMREKQPPREFFYCGDSSMFSITAMCPISHNRLWVMYTLSEYHYLKLIDAEGWVLTTVKSPRKCSGLFSITDDVVLTWANADSTVQVITTDGSVTTYDTGFYVGCLISSATKDTHYLKAYYGQSLYIVNFALANIDQSKKVQLGSALHQSTSQVTSLLGNHLTHSLAKVFSKTPWGSLKHVSAGGHYYAFICSDTVEIHTGAETQNSVIVCTYEIESPVDAHFCLIDEKEMLLVTVWNDKRVHVVDHTDGGRLVRYLDTGPLTLNNARHLATDTDRHVWIGCGQGQVVVLDL